MITEISVENYLSIKDKITLSLESGSGKKLMNNLIEIPEDKKQKLIKTAAIYGPNASGKSNILKSVFFIKNMVQHSHKFNVEVKIPRDPFKLEEESLKKPSKFEIIFIHSKIKYKYGFSCDENKFIEEYLYHWPNGKESKIFHRKNSTDFEFNKKNDKEQQTLKSQTSDNVLYLSRATQLRNKDTKDAYKFIVNLDFIIYRDTTDLVERTAEKIHENKKSKKEIIERLQKADFGILDIDVTKKSQDKERLQRFIEWNVETRGMVDPEMIKELEEEEKFYDIKFIHKTKEGKPINFGPHKESNGTMNMFALIGPIHEILETGKILFIDELELSLHPNIVEILIKLFHSKKWNSKNAQLIFTTHNTNLLNNEIFRKDQIYICSKNKENSTELNSYVDYDISEDSDFEKAYLNGRVGGLPFIDESGLD